MVIVTKPQMSSTKALIGPPTAHPVLQTFGCVYLIREVEGHYGEVPIGAKHRIFWPQGLRGIAYSLSKPVTVTAHSSRRRSSSRLTC